MTECEKGILTIPTKLSYTYAPYIEGAVYEEPVDEVFEITSMMLYGIDVCEYIKEYDMWKLEGAILKKLKERDA